MIFLISKILWSFLRPSSLPLLLAVLGLLLSAGRWRRAGGRLLVAGVALYAAMLVLPIEQWTLRPLEERFPRPALPARVDGIIVIGGAIDGDVTTDRGATTLTFGAERMTDFVALARHYPAARLAFSGGTGGILPGDVAEAGPARDLLSALGLPPERVAFEGASRTTWENAVLSRTLLRPALDETWLLVTSAGHMPRAVGAFRAAGWRVLAWPAGYKTMHGQDWRALMGPFGGRLELLDFAVHEWLGLLAYRVIGHSTALFPAPGGD